MRKILAALVMALSLSGTAQAQSLSIEIDPDNMGVKVEGDDGSGSRKKKKMGISIQGPEGEAVEANSSVTVTSSRTEDRTEDGYRVRYESHAKGKTVIKVLAPEGAVVDIYDGASRVVSEDIPVSYDARPDTFYRFVIRAGDAVWEKKLAAKPGMTLSLWVAAPSAPRPPPVVSRPPPPPEPAPAPAPSMGMPGADFAALKQAISEEGFGDDKLGVLSTAVSNGNTGFTCEQVGELIDLYSFGDEKLNALKLVKNHIVDRNNSFKLLGKFTFDDEKKKAQAMLR
jgi:hypothetical protein